MTDTEYKQLSALYLSLVEKELANIQKANAGIYPRLREAMFYSVSAGGKRLRPCLVLAVCDMFGGDLSCAYPIACALELIHTYSLIHDDLPCMDDDDMRRGRPSNHKVFGEAMAVLAGDGLLSLAHKIMIDGLIPLAEEKREGYIHAMSMVADYSGAGGMVSGQAADIETEGKSDVDDELLSYIHRHKTADMISAAILAGAHVGGADEASLYKLEACAQYIGLLFQITDDILDVKGDESIVGKTLGKDDKEGKLTYVSLYGLEGAKEAARRTAEKAKLAIADIPNNDYLVHTIDNMLNRSY